ncbi:FHA domain-containing protein, partial [Nocardioides hankookensis]
AHAARAVPTSWRVSFDTGESFRVEGLTLVGRRPEARADEQVRHLVALPSTDMSLSKTHAQVQVAADGALVVMDRGSTNGSFLVRQGVPRGLPAGKAATLVDGDHVRFGDREMTVAREG